MQTIEKHPAMLEQFKKIFLFQGASPGLAQMAFFHSGCECVAFEVGESIYSPQNFRRSIALLLSGTATAFKNAGAPSPVAINNFAPGSVFGVASVFSNEERYVSHVKAMRRCKILFLSQELLSLLFHQDSKTAENYITYLSGRIHFLNERISAYTAGSAEKKLALYLVEQSQQQDTEHIKLSCPLTQLCAFLNMGRASLYRILNTLDLEGIIKREGKSIHIIDKPALCRYLYAEEQ